MRLALELLYRPITSMNDGSMYGAKPIFDFFYCAFVIPYSPGLIQYQRTRWKLNDLRRRTLSKLYFSSQHKGVVFSTLDHKFCHRHRQAEICLGSRTSTPHPVLSQASLPSSLPVFVRTVFWVIAPAATPERFQAS